MYVAVLQVDVVVVMEEEEAEEAVEEDEEEERGGDANVVWTQVGQLLCFADSRNLIQAKMVPT